MKRKHKHVCMDRYIPWDKAGREQGCLEIGGLKVHW